MQRCWPNAHHEGQTDVFDRVRAGLGCDGLELWAMGGPGDQSGQGDTR